MNRDGECLPLTESIQIFWLDCKLKGHFSLPNWKISKIDKRSNKVVHNSYPEFPNRKLCSMYFVLPVPGPAPIVKLGPDSVKLE